jgi:integrase
MLLTEFYRAIYLPDRHPQPNQKLTREKYLSELAKFEREAARLLQRPPQLADLSNDLLKLVMCRLVEAGQSVATANCLRRHVASVWRAAHQRGLAAASCTTKPYREERRAPVALLPEECQAILTAIDRLPGRLTKRPGSPEAAIFFRALFLFQYATGTRISATLAIPTANYDWQRGLVKVPAYHQKQRADEVKDLLPSSRTALGELAPDTRGLTLLFGDWPYGVRPLLKRFKRLFVAAGLFASVEAIPKRLYGWHVLRKTFGSHVARRAGKHVACELLGHSAVSVTERYLDPRMSDRPRVCELLDDPFAVRATELMVVAADAAAG